MVITKHLESEKRRAAAIEDAIVDRRLLLKKVSGEGVHNPQLCGTETILTVNLFTA